MDAATHARLVASLNPDALKVSGQFTAVLGCLLGRSWTEPELLALCVTADGFLLGMHRGDSGYNEFLGGVENLHTNIRGAAEAVGLSAADTAALLGLVPAYAAPP